MLAVTSSKAKIRNLIFTNCVYDKPFHFYRHLLQEKGLMWKVSVQLQLVFWFFFQR